MAGFLIAIVSGALMSIQGVFNTEMTETTGEWVSTGWVQFSALIACVALWFFNGRDPVQTILSVEPKYMLLGGVIGAGITFTVIKSMEALGSAKAVLLIVTAQILTAYLIELFGMFGTERQPFEMRRLIGMAVAIAGLVIFEWE